MRPYTRRSDWLDCAKGLGIILVVVGHAIAGSAHAWIYLFHMPLFFMLSGVTFRPNATRTMLVKRLRTLILPYIAFLLLLLLFQDMLMFAHGRPWGEVAHADLKFLKGLLLGGRWLTGIFGTAWFVTVLFGALVLYNLLRRLGGPLSWWFLPLAALMLALAYGVNTLSLPWNAAVIPMAVFFLWCGEVWSLVMLVDGHPVIRDYLSIHVMAGLVAVLILPFVLPMDMKYGDYGTPLLSVLGAIAWSHLFMVASGVLTSGRARHPGLVPMLTVIGRASLVILFIHRVVLIEAEGLLPPLFSIPLALGVSLLCYWWLSNSPPIVRLAFLGKPLEPARGAVIWLPDRSRMPPPTSGA
ncbi:MAG: acyltransferase family protein [Sphingobium sp.]